MKDYVQMHMPSFRMIKQSPYRFWYCQSLYGLSFVCKTILCNRLCSVFKNAEAFLMTLLTAN